MTERNSEKIDYRTVAILLMISALALAALTTLLTQYNLTNGYYEINIVPNLEFTAIGYYLHDLIISGLVIGETYVLLRFDETGRLSIVVNAVLVAVFAFDFSHDASLLLGFVM